MFMIKYVQPQLKGRRMGEAREREEAEEKGNVESSFWKVSSLLQYQPDNESLKDLQYSAFIHYLFKVS